MVLFLYQIIHIRGGEWSFKKFGSRKILADFHRSCSLVFLVVVCVSESRFFDEAVSKSWVFLQADLSRSTDFLAFCLLLLIACVVDKRW